jgi:hypothetical protein
VFDAQRDLAALVYDDHDDPDAVPRDFAAQLNAHGFRAEPLRRGANSGNRLRNRQIGYVPSGALLCHPLPSRFRTRIRAMACREQACKVRGP